MVPQQFGGDCEEVKIIRDALGRSAKSGNVARALETVQAALGGERFRDIGRILENGGGDCDNMSAWRTAELRQLGNVAARPFMTHRLRLDGGSTYHALVLWPPFGSCNYETSEDPSLMLGMGGAGRATDRLEEIRKNEERCDILREMMRRGTPLRSLTPGAPGFAPSADAPISEVLDDVLGLRRRALSSDGAVTAIDDLLRRMAA